MNDSTIILIILVVLVALLFIYLKGKKEKAKGALPSKIVFDRSTRKKSSTDELQKTLEKMVMGNRETAKRLIEYERKQKPTAPESELISSAIDRLRRDRG